MYPQPLIQPFNARPYLDTLIQPQPYPRARVDCVPHIAPDNDPAGSGDPCRPDIPIHARVPDQADADERGRGGLNSSAQYLSRPEPLILYLAGNSKHPSWKMCAHLIDRVWIAPPRNKLSIMPPKTFYSTDSINYLVDAN